MNKTYFQDETKLLIPNTSDIEDNGDEEYENYFGGNIICKNNNNINKNNDTIIIKSLTSTKLLSSSTAATVTTTTATISSSSSKKCPNIDCNSSSSSSCSISKNKNNNDKNNKSKLINFFKILLSYNLYINYILTSILFIIIIIIMYLCRNYAKKILIWIENQNSWLIFSIFILMFVIVSFPITIGYLVLMITSGYLFGYIKGFLTVILGANIGVAIAHNIIKCIHGKFPIYKLIKSDTGRAILRVISGPRAFKVVMFTRLTPIPFGLQNTIFGVSSVDSRTYHTATLIGLLPAQAINVYLGSTLRSMHDVLNNHHTALTGYIIFAVQTLIAGSLMLWVVHKAKTELSQALLSDIGSDHKRIVIDIDT